MPRKSPINEVAFLQGDYFLCFSYVAGLCLDSLWGCFFADALEVYGEDSERCLDGFREDCWKLNNI